MQTKPIPLTHFNQLLHLNHEAGVTEGFFKYYFLTRPAEHPYLVDEVLNFSAGLNEKGISSLKQLEWGFRRFYIDSLYFLGNIRSGYRELRVKSYSELKSFFSPKCYSSKKMRLRGKVLPFFKIPVDDRYLISEVSYKAYNSYKNDESTLIESMLLEEYKKRGVKNIKIGSLFDKSSSLAKSNPHGQMMLAFAGEELLEVFVESEDDIRKQVQPIALRFKKARDIAIKNTRLYLSIVNELDVYAATSMRKRQDFRNMAKDCEYIFNQEGLRRYHTRYFDPTMSAAEGHEDKGLIECLMVKCSKVVLYFAGDKDSFGKDAEIAMAMSLGKPVIILCPDTPKGKEREEFFRDVHPLSRLIEFKTGVAIGAIVTRDRNTVARLLERIFDNKMEYDLEHNGDGYFRLKERLTGSVVRLQTNNGLIRETFWNNYHNIP